MTEKRGHGRAAAFLPPKLQEQRLEKELMREKIQLTVAKQPLSAKNVKTRFKELLIGQISQRIFLILQRFVFRTFLFY